MSSAAAEPEMVCLSQLTWFEIDALRHQPVEVTSGHHRGKLVTVLEGHHVCDTVVVQFGDGRASDHIHRQHLSVRLNR